ncbi:DNA replication complex GINS protein PSF3 [Desmophyllum pertusum]|uniref:DNA replication complex GINS protein PSF3 n=1 Tax=Desmophyllum pertusum TaxID=174260 RepID=A0A9X0CTG9_9CNID|nr:DNA replication complex GINS protein PSF3 [Desmophyllum pertusum]
MASGAPPLRSHPSSELDYFDIDDIIATQGRIPSKLEVQIYNLGFLDPSSEGNDLQAGAKLELPLWLSKELSYKDGYREVFKADASVVDLHRLGPYFYEFGTKLLHFDFEENSQMASSMQETFIKRFRKIMDSSQNAANEDASLLTSKLDHIEKQVFSAGRKGVREFLQWETGNTSKLTTSETVVNHKKRKRSMLE